MKPLNEKIMKEIRSTLTTDVRWGSPRIDGKKTLSEKITNQTTFLMKDFHLWIGDNFIKGDMYSTNHFYIPKTGKFTNHTIDELLIMYLDEKFQNPPLDL